MKQATFKGYANSFQAIARLGLANIGALLSHLDNPQDRLRFVHIAGTNGKGSVATFLSCMLTKAGYKTGSYISPNMLRVNERISIDGKAITDGEMKRLFTRVEAACVRAEADTGVYPTQFEIWTAMAFCYFAEQECDYVVLETGLGGRRDATNIVSTTELAVINAYQRSTIIAVAGKYERADCRGKGRNHQAGNPGRQCAAGGWRGRGAACGLARGKTAR